MSSALERTEEPDGKAVANGTFIAVVGPSGAGKDTLMNRARRVLANRSDIFFVRRVITRPADGATENHIPCTRHDFERKLNEGAFAFHWDAHGLKYGLPAEIDERIRAGECAVCNGSRAALAGLSRHYANFRVIEITVSADVLARRLADRGRESRQEIRARLERSAVLNARWPDATVIDNGGDLETAANALIAAILSPD